MPGSKVKFEVGHIHREPLRIDEKLVRQFAAFSGDDNPIHLDPAAARQYGYPKAVAHGAILLAFLSRLIGTKIPGHGAVWMGQSMEWKAPVFVGDEVEVAVKIISFSAAAGVLELQVSAVNQKGETVMEGMGKVKLPEKVAQKKTSIDAGARVVLVTGAGRGIGASIAALLGRSEWMAAVHYSSSKREAEKLVADIETDGGRARGFQADFSRPEAARAVVGEVRDYFGRVDAVVHCATPPIVRADVGNLTYAQVEPYLKMYLGGALELIGAAKEGMRGREFGRFVFLGTAALCGQPPAGWCAYLSAKAALEGLVRCAAVELGPVGITVNMVSPGLVVTDLTSDIPQRAKEVEARRSPVRRLADPEDVANVVHFLLSPGASYINGANIPVTGGPV